jgi:CopG family nickel-responsive transcriptional regulator
VLLKVKVKALSIVSLSLPKELLKELDAILGEERCASRSEVLRQAVRSYITEYKELEKLKGDIIASITVLYEKTEQNEELFRLQHEFSDMITAYLHSHLTDTSCLEVMVIKGPSKRLKSLIDGLKANKPVKQIKFSIMITDEPE